MPWKVAPVSDLRFALIHHVESLKQPVALVCRQFGVSRKTAYKWLKRWRENSSQNSGAESLRDRSRRPRQSPGRTSQETEQSILDVRDRFGWGARKIRASLKNSGRPAPSIHTTNAVLKRHQRIAAGSPPPQPCQSFERSTPNQLWQIDFKGPLEVERQRVYPFSILDDHSRYLLSIEARNDVTMKTAWSFLWNAFAEHGLPDSILSDNAFSNLGQNRIGLSRFDSWLVRLHIRPLHGRPYHPQTQGKVERLHRTYLDEMLRHVRRDSLDHFNLDADRWRRETYNTQRPHEALGDLPPISRYLPSSRRRPDELPKPHYPDQAATRKVSSRGEISYQGYRILVGKGLEGESVRIDEQEHGWAIFYDWFQLRLLAHENLRRDTVL